jgi:hypothetical protein
VEKSAIKSAIYEHPEFTAFITVPDKTDRRLQVCRLTARGTVLGEARGEVHK